MDWLYIGKRREETSTEEATRTDRGRDIAREGAVGVVNVDDNSEITNTRAGKSLGSSPIAVETIKSY